ncbi:MAG: carbohydrate-binding protein [Spirochaeta sp.]
MNKERLLRGVVITAGALMLAIIAGCASAPAAGDAGAEPVRIRLRAENAEMHSNGALVFENPNIGYWETTEDRITWDADVEVGGTYMVSLYAACDPEFPGSIVDVTIDGQTVQVEIPDTGGWQEYRTLEAGTVELSPGSYELVVQASHVDNRFVANLSDVNLVLQ